MRNSFKVLMVLILAVGFVLFPLTETVWAEEAAKTGAPADQTSGTRAIAAAAAIGLAAVAGALAMGLAISRAADGISRQPEAEGPIRTALMLGLVFIETVVIYALIVAILIIFVL